MHVCKKHCAYIRILQVCRTYSSPLPHLHVLATGTSLHGELWSCLHVPFPSHRSLLPPPLQSLVLSNQARHDSTTGEIVNLMAIDAQRVMDIAGYLHYLWAAPLQIVLAIYFLYQTMGPSVFAGVAVMVLLIPVNAVIAFISRRFQVMTLCSPCPCS